MNKQEVRGTTELHPLSKGKQVCAHACTRTHTHTPPSPTPPSPSARTRARAHTHTHTPSPTPPSPSARPDWGPTGEEARV